VISDYSSNVIKETAFVIFDGLIDHFPSYEAYTRVNGGIAEEVVVADPAGGVGGLLLDAAIPFSGFETFTNSIPTETL
jgi:hypothetical protein